MSLKRKFSFLLVIVVVFLTLLHPTTALETNDTLRINAEYRVNDILSAANASISIFLPSSIVAVNNATMNLSSKGVFFYDYLIPAYDGRYEVHIDYYKSSWLAEENSYFLVGSVNTFNWRYCPSGTMGYVGLLVILVIIFIMGVIGMGMKHAGMTLGASVLLLFSSAMTWNCGDFFGLTTIVLGVIFLISAGAMKY